MNDASYLACFHGKPKRSEAQITANNTREQADNLRHGAEHAGLLRRTKKLYQNDKWRHDNNRNQPENTLNDLLHINNPNYQWLYGDTGDNSNSSMKIV